MDLFDLYAKISLDDSEYNKGISDATQKGQTFASKLGTGIANATKVVAKGIAIATSAAAAGAVALTKQALTAYADYEQLVGGVETLFGAANVSVEDFAKTNGLSLEAAREEMAHYGDQVEKVLDYADNAYKTSGLSANEYMETATSFSASLISSLGEYSYQAANYADMAIVDMSDNANKMGSSMESIQNAYQGFAKQNYTMLDNLKLGYGGTKEEMQRLLDDAGKISGMEFDISSFADVVDAIHIMQEEMGIAGTTAKEAEKTISGSIGMLKGAWKNLVAGFGKPGASISKLAGDVVDSFSSVVTNVTPIMKNIVNAIPQAVSAIMPAIKGIAPDLLDTFADVAGLLLTAFVDLLPELAQTAGTLIDAIIDTISKNGPMIAAAAVTIIVTLCGGLLDGLPELTPVVVEVVVAIVGAILDHLPEILEAGIEVLIALSDGLIEALPLLAEKVPGIIITIVETIFTHLPEIIEAAVRIVLALIGGLFQAIPSLIEGIGTLIQTMIDEFGDTDWGRVGKDLINSIGEGLREAWEGITRWFNDAWDSLFDGKSVGLAADSGGGGKRYGISGSHAGGLGYVPYDGYIAELHRGERVLTASDNNLLSKLVSLLGVKNITSPSGQNCIVLSIDGHELARFLAPAMSTQLMF